MDLRNEEDYDDDEHHEAFQRHQQPPGYGNYYRYDDSDDFDTGTSDSEFFSRSDDEGRYDSPTETTDMEIRRRHQPRNYKLGDTSSSSEDESGIPRAPPTQNVFEHQASPRMMRGGGDGVNSPTSPPMFLRHSMPSLARPLDPAVRSSFTAQDLAVESEQEGHDADVEPSDLDPMYSGHEETDDERKQGNERASSRGSDGGGKPAAPPKHNVFDHNTSSSGTGREHLSPLILTRTRPLDSVFKAKIGSFPLLTDDEVQGRTSSQPSSEIKVFDPSSAASSSSVESPIQRQKHTVTTLPSGKGTKKSQVSNIPPASPLVEGIGEIPPSSSDVADTVSQLPYRPRNIDEVDMEGHHRTKEAGDFGLGGNFSDEDYVTVDGSAIASDNVGVSERVNEEIQQIGNLSDYDHVGEVEDSTPETHVVEERVECKVTDYDESDGLEEPSEEHSTAEASTEVIGGIAGPEQNRFAGIEATTTQHSLVEEPSGLDYELVGADRRVESNHASNSRNEEENSVTPPRSNRKNSRFEILSDEKNPLSDIKKLQDRAMRRRRDMQTRMHDLECQLASVTSMHAEEKMDLDLALRDTLDRCVREPLEEAAERLTMERESSTLGPSMAELGSRLNNLDNRMTHHLFVELQNAKREKLESLHDTLYQDTIPAFRIENSTSDKIEGGIVRRYEQLAGVIARQYHQECAARRASIEDIKKKIDNVANQDQRRLEDTLATIEDLREQLRRERANRIAADTKIKNEIARTTAAMKRALLAAVGVGS